MLGTAFRSASDSPFFLLLVRLFVLFVLSTPFPSSWVQQQPSAALSPSPIHHNRARMSNGATPNGPSAPTHTESQRYLSTRGDDSGVGPFLPFFCSGPARRAVYSRRGCRR
jgi:hypothetical protein